MGGRGKDPIIPEGFDFHTNDGSGILSWVEGLKGSMITFKEALIKSKNKNISSREVSVFKAKIQTLIIVSLSRLPKIQSLFHKSLTKLSIVLGDIPFREI